MPVKALVPETSVSTNSTTGAKAHCNEHIIDKKRLLSIAFFWYTSTNMSVYPSDKLFKLLRGIIIVLIAAIIIGTVIAVVKKTKERASGRQDEESDAGAVYIPPIRLRLLRFRKNWLHKKKHLKKAYSIGSLSKVRIGSAVNCHRI